MLTAVSRGAARIRNIPDNLDCRATLRVLSALGVPMRVRKQSPVAGSLSVLVRGVGLNGFKTPRHAVSVGDSGTTLRLCLGLVAGQKVKVRFSAGRSLAGRPMKRVTGPLRLMGAHIQVSRKKGKPPTEEYAPLVITGGSLTGIRYRPAVASAQVKSAVLLAALNASGRTTVSEAVPTRDHTERLLRSFGADIRRTPGSVTVRGGRELCPPGSFTIPGDISSAAFFMVLASLLADASITLKDVSLNPSRTGVITVLKRMGGHISVRPRARQGSAEEPRGDILVRSAALRATTVGRREIPSLIDEIPILMVAACFAKGTTRFTHVNELRVKETDRIASMTRNLTLMGARITSRRSGSSEVLSITGTGALAGRAVKSYADHRTAMSMVVAGLAACGQTRLDDSGCIEKSFPGFLQCLKKLLKEG